MRSGSKVAYKFGAFQLDVAEQRLQHDGRPVPLTPKVFDVLRLLVQNSGHLVEKETLLAEVWPGSFVEEGALSRSISILRKALGESDSDRKYIETVPKRGYRFVALVTDRIPDGSGAPVGVTDRTDAPLQAKEFAPIPETSTARPAQDSVAKRVASAGGLLIAGALFLAVFGQSWRETNALTNVTPVHRQVTFTGKERAPTISPDGRRIAYVSSGKPESQLMVQELAGGQPLAIFTAPELGHLRWSPDGTALIVWARGSGWDGVYALPPLGGTPHRIAGGQYIACWSPDSSTIAVGSYRDGKIWFFDRFGDLLRSVSLGDVNGPIVDLSWSPADVLAVATSDQGQSSVWTVKPDGTEQRRVVVADSQIPSARWGPNGDAIYYFRRVNQTVSLFKIAVPIGRDSQSGVPTTLIAGLESDHSFALSEDGRRLVYARAPYYSNLWLVEANGGGNERVATRALTHGTALVERPSISPDGTSIVFSIGHEPATNLYTMPITGGVPKQLTFLDSFNLEPVWSADGEQIAFASTEGGKPRVWTVNAGGGLPKVLSSGDMSDTYDLTWSPGSRILYQQSGYRRYYEIDPRTPAERVLINARSVGWTFSPVYSPDGRQVAVKWNRPPDTGIWVIDVSSGREALVYATAAASAMPVGWSADGRSIYLIEGKNLNSRGMTAPIGETVTEARIVRVPVTGHAARTVVVLPFEEMGGVSMTADGRLLVCVVYSSQSDVWVVENFDTPPASGT
jgi:Tol biopolymer transport system component/DNA-binding winged helix-turn-helix (wHTH) protein